MNKFKRVLFIFGSSWMTAFFLMVAVLLLSVIDVGNVWFWRVWCFLVSLMLLIVDATMFYGTPYNKAQWAKHKTDVADTHYSNTHTK